MSSLTIAIASGKGGTGKTTLATTLAQVLSDKRAVSLLDCDVEEPNAHIFLKPVIERRETVEVPVPQVDEQLCNGCGQCDEICQFNAIVTVSGTAMVFEQLCHSCGGCVRVCPQQAISERQKNIGQIEYGHSAAIQVVTGTLTIGEAMAPPLIRAVKNNAAAADITIVDCPPGTSCPMITAVHGCDFAVLVTEPTPFGLHDLRLAVDTLRQLEIPFGVVINRADSGDERVCAYCRTEKIPLLAQIPHSRAVAAAYSRGDSILDAMPQLRDTLGALPEEITRLTRSSQ